MDPLKALSLAGTIVQFVQFASALFNSAKSVHNSASGASQNGDSIEIIYSKLSAFNSGLQFQEAGDNFRDDANSKQAHHDSDIRALAVSCQGDCARLLEVSAKLNVKTRSGPGWWKSFQVAFAEVAKSNDIKELKQRITEYQRMIIVLFCATSNESITLLRAQMWELRQLTQAPQSQQSQQLGQVLDQLSLLTIEVNKMHSNHIQQRLSPQDIDALTSKVLDICSRSRKFSRQYEVLCGLNFEQRPARYESIPKAHRQTLSWVFEEDENERSRLVKWLEEEDQKIFWISGKPGSGKSTLIKFIANHQRSQNSLESWAGSNKLMIACHYFWAAGTPLQRSHEGLLRSLLYDILDHSPALIPIVAPERWLQSSQDQSSPQYSPTKPWTLEELEDTIQKIAGQGELPMRFCLFVDGLDEYSGDHAKLCQALHKLSESPNIKICLSSRPWNIFEENFGRQAETKLYVHELTRSDIHNYAESELSQHPRWSHINSNEQNTAKILEEITDRAQGVFLWVFLVTRELRDGMTNYDTIAELWKRLDAIPTDLEQFFKHILLSVEPFYHEKMAGTLEVALTARRPLPTIMYGFQDLEYDDHHYSAKDLVEEWDEAKTNDFIEPFERRLSSRCKGLLEIRSKHVEFLHRTVSDFLRTGEIREFITSHTRPRFDPNLTIFQSYMSWVKHSSRLRFTDISEALSYAHCSSTREGSDESFLHELIDEFEWSLQTLADQSRVDMFNYSISKQPPYRLFRTYVLRSALDSYVSKKLESNPRHFDHLEPCALSCVLRTIGHERDPTTDVAKIWTAHRLNLLRYLLDSNHGPNEIHQLSSGPETAWCDFLKQTISKVEDVGGWDELQSPALFNAAISSGAITMLLDFGADPNAAVFNGEVTAWMMFLLAGIRNPTLTEHAEGYIRLLDRMLTQANFASKFSIKGTTTTEPEAIGSSGTNERKHRPAACTGASARSQQDTNKPQRDGKKEEARMVAWRILSRFLSRLSHGAKDKKRSQGYHEMHLLAEILRVFVTRAAHPSLGMENLIPAIKTALPLSVQSPVLDAINDYQRKLEEGSLRVKDDRRRTPTSPVSKARREGGRDSSGSSSPVARGRGRGGGRGSPGQFRGRGRGQRANGASQ